MKVGFFGKLPGYGDFVQRNVSPELIGFWDNWLMQSIDTSMAQLKDHWRDIYFTSPVWRFTVQRGVINDSTISGLMMPSVDASGRNYPFFVFCELPAPANLFSLSAELEPLHIQGEDLIIPLLSQTRPDLDDLADILGQHYGQYRPTVTSPASSDITSSSADLFKLSSPQPVSAQHMHNLFCDAMLARQHLRLSIWAHSASEQFDYLQRYFRGMPPVDAFASLLNGN